MHLAGMIRQKACKKRQSWAKERSSDSLRNSDQRLRRRDSLALPHIGRSRRSDRLISRPGSLAVGSVFIRTFITSASC